MKIAICSYRRPHTIFQNTIASLVRSGVDLKDVTVFISDPKERAGYEKALSGLVTIVDSVPTKTGNLNFILDYYPLGTEILFVDDDIKKFERLSDNRKKLIETDISFAHKGFQLCRDNGATSWGIYAVRNAFFMKERSARGLYLLVGSCYGLINTGSEYHRVYSDEKEDYRRGFQIFEAEGGLIRLDYITVDTAYYKEPGGMQSTRTDSIIENAAKKLALDYPSYCKVYKSTSKNTWELRLNNHKYKTKVLGG